MESDNQAAAAGEGAEGAPAFALDKDTLNVDVIACLPATRSQHKSVDYGESSPVFCWFWKNQNFVVSKDPRVRRKRIRRKGRRVVHPLFSLSMILQQEWVQLLCLLFKSMDLMQSN